MNSNDKMQEIYEQQLYDFQIKFAGAKKVLCATSTDSNYDVFDFSNVKPEDIRYGIHGENYIRAKARKCDSLEISVCYLKYVTKEAKVIRSNEVFGHSTAKEFQDEKIIKPQSKLPVDILIEYVKKYSISTPHSERFSKQVSDLFDINLKKDTLKKIKKQEAEDIIHFNKTRNNEI